MTGQPDERVQVDAVPELLTASARIPRRRVATVVIVAMLAVLWAGWLLVAAQQRAEVRVWFDAQAVECRQGVSMVEELGMDPDPVYVHVVEASPGLDCSLRVHVENRGLTTATVRGLALPVHGPDGGAGIRARELAPLGLFPEEADATGWSAVEARYRFDHRLEAGERLALQIGLEFRPEGCAPQGGTLWLTDAPAVEVSALGLRGMRTPTGEAYAVRGTRDSDCAGR